MKDALGMGWEERTVTVSREKLLSTLKENREKHAREYQESVAGYKVLAKERLQKKLSWARKTLKANFDEVSRKIDEFDLDDDENPLTDTVSMLSSVSFSLEVPRDHTKSYDVAISMAEWEVGDTIELTQSQFQCFVLDDWDWKKKFSVMNKLYTSASR